MTKKRDWIYFYFGGSEATPFGEPFQGGRFAPPKPFGEPFQGGRFAPPKYKLYNLYNVLQKQPLNIDDLSFGDSF